TYYAFDLYEFRIDKSKEKERLNMSSARGLEGVVAATSGVSTIIDSELTYRGYDIDELADNASFEEVVYLLLNGELPNKTELDELTKALAEHAEIPQEL